MSKAAAISPWTFRLVPRIFLKDSSPAPRSRSPRSGRRAAAATLFPTSRLSPVRREAPWSTPSATTACRPAARTPCRSRPRSRSRTAYSSAPTCSTAPARPPASPRTPASACRTASTDSCAPTVFSRRSHCLRSIRFATSWAWEPIRSTPTRTATAFQTVGRRYTDSPRSGCWTGTARTETSTATG